MKNQFVYLIFSLLILASCKGKDKKEIPFIAPKDTDIVAPCKSEGAKNGFEFWDYLGYAPQTQIPNLTLVELSGKPVEFYEVLKENKPLVLISGSYTCDLTRKNLPAIEDFYQKYGNKVAIYFVYTTEAYPKDADAYSIGSEKRFSRENVEAHIEANQPKTFGERKTLAQKWVKELNIKVPVLLDNPSNQFWNYFGQAPNMAYLIKPNGMVIEKEIWLEMNKFERAVQQLISK